jgi:ribosomal protein L29
MKLKDFKNEIKGLDLTALINKAKALKVEINDLVLDKNINKMKNLKSINNRRKDLARVMTVMAQKQLIAMLEPKAETVKEDKKVTASAVIPSQGEGSVKNKKTEEGGKK